MIAKTRPAMVLAFLAGALLGCGESRRRPEPAVDAAAAPPPAAAEAPSVPPPSLYNSTVEKPPVGPGPEYIAYGVCPYSCCSIVRTFALIGKGNVRVSPTFNSDVKWQVADGERIRRDNSVVITRPTGLAVIAGETAFPTQQLTGPRPGDTLEILASLGNGISRVRWQGREFETKTHESGTPVASLQIIREPGQEWWVHVTDTASEREGWMHMGGVASSVNSDPNACH